MIIGNIKNRVRYAFLGEEVIQALDYFASVLDKKTEEPLEKADVVLPGEKVRIKIRPMRTKPASDCTWEAHVKELDIHFNAYGVEKIGVADVDDLTVIDKDEVKDIIYLNGGEGDYITVRPGTFLIVFPEDAHMPCIAADKPVPVGKMIAKIAVKRIN